MEDKLKELNSDLDNFIQILFFFNMHFLRMRNFSVKNNYLYYYYLSRRYKDLLNKKEKIIKEAI